MTTRLRLAAVLTVMSLLLLPGCGGTSGPDPTVSNGRIVFVSSAGGGDLYLVNEDGTGLVNLTNDGAACYDPRWSPDGGKIAFVSTCDGNEEIYVINADGTGKTRLTNDPATDTGPAWSPDGTRIAFASYRDGDFEIYVMSATAGDAGDLVKLTDNTEYDYSPAWSLGNEIAFISDRTGSRDIFKINPDGTGETNLTGAAGATEEYPAWSPDGTKIAFVESYNLNVMNADGSGRTQLTESGADASDGRFSWSPDGGHIAFVSDRASEGRAVSLGIYIMNSADGSDVTPLIEAGYNSDPAWSADGAKIVFTASTDGGSDIWIMNADGSGQAPLIQTAGTYESSPRWRPEAG